MIIAVNFQLKQLERRSLKKVRASTGFAVQNMNYFIYIVHIDSLGGEAKRGKTKLFWTPGTTWPPCDKGAQLVEHRTGIAEVMGSNPVEALIFFRLLSSCLRWLITVSSTFQEVDFDGSLLPLFIT